MAMGKHSLNIQTRSAGPDVKGAGVVSTEGDGKPSTNSGASTQSPQGLKQPKMPSTTGTFDGSEANSDNC